MITAADSASTPRTTAAHVTASDGAIVQLLVHRPAQPRGWLVWAHGGSWLHGSVLGWAPVTPICSVQTA